LVDQTNQGAVAMITLANEEAQQVLDALQCATPPTFSAKIVEDWQNAVEFLRARLAQPEPEPVAKMRELLEVQGCDGNWNFDPYMQGMFNGMEMMMSLVDGRDPAFRKAPDKWLYTAPPQREWVGLTDEEYEAMAEKYVTNCYFDTLTYARAVETKLKEKNT
jgi:hypothetical protein